MNLLGEITKIRKDLTVKPFTNTNYGNEAPAFAVYSESKRKLYLPRFYGIKEFGPPKTIKIDPGEDAPMEFTGKLKDKQLPRLRHSRKQQRDDKWWRKLSVPYWQNSDDVVFDAGREKKRQ